MDVPQHIQNKIVDLLEGTSDMLTGAIEDLVPDISYSEVEEIMFDNHYDRCSRCGIWTPQYDLYDDPQDVTQYVCSSCKE